VAERLERATKPGNAGGAKEPQFKDDDQRRKSPEIGMSLTTPESVWNLQQSLQAKAKANPTLRFYSLYDKIYRRDVLAFAWQRCRTNGGSAGVDGQTFEQIESGGLGVWLDELTEQLKSKTYKPQAVRRVHIPKADGKLRPLGIPTIKDRVAQMAAVIVLAPIFEADLPEEQYAYRTNRNAHDAIGAVHKWVNQGHRQVVDADLSGYFDTIPHHELMKSLARRVSDGAMLKLIQISVQMLDTHLMIGTYDGTLEQAPDTFNAVGVNVSNNPFLNRVSNDAMLSVGVFDSPVGREFVSVDRFCIGRGIVLNELMKRWLVRMGNDLQSNFALSLHGSDGDSFVSLVSTSHAAHPAQKMGAVH